MGRGIVAAIPIIVAEHERLPFREEQFIPGFFDNYDQIEVDGRKSKTFLIKENLLISNYKSLLTEFYGLIGVDLFRGTELTYSDIPDANSLDEFCYVFSRKDISSAMPQVYSDTLAFDVMGCICEKYWLFYNGSYKAYLEVFSTFFHFECILAKTMDNPLATAIKFGIFG